MTEITAPEITTAVRRITRTLNARARSSSLSWWVRFDADGHEVDVFQCGMAYLNPADAPDYKYAFAVDSQSAYRLVDVAVETAIVDALGRVHDAGEAHGLRIDMYEALGVRWA